MIRNMESVLKTTIKKMADERFPDDTVKHDAFIDGALDALRAVSCFLSVSSHLGDSVKINDLREYISQLEK